MSEKAAVGKIVAKQAEAERQGGVLAKLIIFALSLGIVPISSYFISKDHLWNGNTTYAAITAIISANIVLVLYIIESLREESRITNREASTESKKDR